MTKKDKDELILNKEKLIDIISNFLNSDFDSLEEFDEVAKDLPVNQKIRMPYSEKGTSVEKIVRAARKALEYKIHFSPFCNLKIKREPFIYKKPKSTKEVIEDLQILYSKQNINEHPQSELLTNAINFLKSKEERKATYRDTGQIAHRLFRSAEIQSLTYGPFKASPILFTESTIGKCKTALEMLDRLERFIKVKFDEEGIHIDSAAELINEFKAKIKKEEAKAKSERLTNAIDFLESSEKSREAVSAMIGRAANTMADKPRKIQIDISNSIAQLKEWDLAAKEALKTATQLNAARETNFEKTFVDSSERLENLRTLDGIKNECENHLKEISEDGRSSCNMTEAHNAITSLTKQHIKIVEALQKHIGNGNI